MAAKPLVAVFSRVRPTLVAYSGRSVFLKSSFHIRSAFHTTQQPFFPATAAPSSGDNPISQTMAQSTSPSGQTPDDNRHSAYLGEADSNDGFEAYKDAHGDPPPAIDGTHAAYLGEADSDDGFESHREIHGVKLDPVDASQSAFLGEADSDDGFESDVEINPDKYRHKFEDVSSSGMHGQSGEGDQ